SQYLFAPVLWSFWLLSLGLPHPMRNVLAGLWGGNAIPVLFSLFVASELLNVAIGLWAVRGREHRHLTPWVPTMHLYFPLGCLAAWKAVYELVAKPFYWDKTQHGIFDANHDEAAETVISREPIPLSSSANANGQVAAGQQTTGRVRALHAISRVG